MDRNKEKQLVLEALAAGQYNASFDPAHPIIELTRYDGSKFYLMEDDARSYLDLGTIAVEVEGMENHVFIYNMENGDWLGDDLCDDEEVVSALEKLSEFIYYEDYDADRQWEDYCKEKGIAPGTRCYRSGDDYCPKEVLCLSDDEVEVPLQYFFIDGQGAIGECIDMDVVMTEEDLYDVYQLAVKTGAWSDKDFQITGKELREALPDLYVEITEQIMEDACEDNGQQLEFCLLLSKELFDEKL